MQLWLAWNSLRPDRHGPCHHRLTSQPQGLALDVGGATSSPSLFALKYLQKGNLSECNEL